MPEQPPTPDAARRIPSHESSKIADPWSDARFIPDLMLPVQYNDLVCRRWQMDGETRLVLAVLEDALRTYVKAGTSRARGRSKRLTEVTDWFHSSARYPFSFEYICEVLGMPASALRARLITFTVKDFPTKQVHSVGRRQVMRPHRYSSRSRLRTRGPLNQRPVTTASEESALPQCSA